MKLFKRIIVIIGVILFFLTINLFFYAAGLEPKYDGKLDLKGLSATVEVNFDTYGIPHIFANNNQDAYRALGYIHAQDRLWQMELMRRIAPGRLSEMFGPDLVETDKFFKTLGIHRQSKKEAAELLNTDNNQKILALSYLDGVNQFIEEGPTPVEFMLLGLDKEAYTLEDMYNVIGYIAFSFAHAQKCDPIFTNIAKNLGPEYLTDLDVEPDGNTEMIKNYPKQATLDSLLAKSSNVVNTLPAPAWLGSNSWVVSPEKSATGNVIFANDPHMQFSQPGVWYEAHVVTPDWERYGYHAALIPFALLTHNREYSVGLTMFLNDDVDFYYNAEVENNFEEEIIVKDDESITIEVQESTHGPIMSSVIGSLEDQPVALWWTYLQTQMESMEALYLINHAKGIDDVRLGASKINAPGLNVMYGDAKGNIAWWASAKLHLMDSTLNRRLILDAKDPRTKEITWLPFEENPQAENPPWNYVYSTNNQPDTIKGGLYPGYYVPEDRALRIVELLESKKELDVEDYQQFFLDNTNPIAAKIAHEFAGLLEAKYEPSKAAIKILADWDGNYRRESTAPVIYEKMIYHTLRLAMKNKLDSIYFQEFFNTHQVKKSLDNLIHNDESVWWDDPSTSEIETRSMIFNQAFTITIEELTEQLGDLKKWKWGDVHTLEHPHPMGQVSLLKPFFNVGTFKMDAADAVLNKLSYTRDGSGTYPITSGPSTRRLINFADIENSLSILPTGQSGNPLSEHYNDQAELYVKGKWRKMLMNKDEIKQKSTGTLVLSPN